MVVSPVVTGSSSGTVWSLVLLPRNILSKKLCLLPLVSG